MSRMGVFKTLAVVENLLNKWLKPTRNAESWDNVGLLVGSGKSSKEDFRVSSVLLCIDLTSPVLEEAIKKNINLIVAYHPVIFSGIKSVGYNSTKEQIVARCIANDICVYSPHTALDSVHGGINDLVVWNLRGQSGSKSCPPLIPKKGPVKGVEFRVSKEISRDIVGLLNDKDDINYGFEFEIPRVEDSQKSGSESSVVIRAYSDEIENFKLVHGLSGNEAAPYLAGAGRFLEYPSPKSATEFLIEVEQLFRQGHVWSNLCGRTTVSKVAFCAGSGGSLFKGLHDVDLVLTGEMGHHEILDCIERGVGVILVGHCVSERQYMPTLKNTLEFLLDGPQIIISEKDEAPLKDPK